MIFKHFFKSKGTQIATELFSIVVGILLALSIDEWVTDYKYKRFNEELIQEMYLELDEDISEVAETIALVEENTIRIEQHIEEVKKDPAIERQSIRFAFAYDRNLFWQTAATKADLRLLQQEAETLVSSIYTLNIMQDAVQEHYKVIRSFLFSVCEKNETMRISCLEKKVTLYRYLIILLNAEKEALINFKKEYESYLKQR